MDYGRKFHIFERTAWLGELKLLKAFTYRLLVQIQPSEQLLKAITSYHQPAAVWLPCDELGSWDCLVWG